MRKLTILLSACALTLIGSGVSANADSNARPFKGTIVGEAVFAPAPAQCPADPFVIVTTVAHGVMSHLGAVTMTSQHCAGITFAGTSMIVAANGDKVFMTYDGVGPFDPANPPAVVHLTGTFHIIGGTGRFSGATGGGTYTADLAFKGIGPGAAPWPGVWNYTGTIGY
jgi:hypothetical protein